MLRFDAVTAMRSMEEFTRSVGGYHFLYADTFLTRWPFLFSIFVTTLSFFGPREEFEEMFDTTAYERVRTKYHAEG